MNMLNTESKKTKSLQQKVSQKEPLVEERPLFSRLRGAEGGIGKSFAIFSAAWVEGMVAYFLGLVTRKELAGIGSKVVHTAGFMVSVCVLAGKTKSQWKDVINSDCFVTLNVSSL